MSITDELRECATDWGRDLIGSGGKAVLFNIADRIDAEHEKRIASVMNDALYHANEKDMADLGWIRLPKDANGEYIHIGDELDGYGYPNGGAYCKAIVNEVTILAGPKDSSYRSWLMWDAAEVRHHHEPTVEDVLREFGDWYVHTKGGCDEDGIIAEYAAKLQLKETE